MTDTPINPLERLGGRVAGVQDELLQQQDALQHARRRLLTENETGARRARFLPAALPAAALAAAAALVVVFTQSSRELTFEVVRDSAVASPGKVGQWMETAQELPLRFSDGSSFLLSPRSRARVSRVSDTGADVTIERGRVAVSIPRRGETRWRVTAGPFLVTVTGTRFDVGWDPADQRFSLDLHDGTVLVSGPSMDGARAVVAGQQIRVSLAEPGASDDPQAGDADEPQDETAAAPQDPEVRTPDHETAVPDVADAVAGDKQARSPAAAKRGKRDKPNWAALIAQERYADAIDAAERIGFTEVCATAPGRRLVRLGDAARYARVTHRSRQAYAAVRRRFSGSDHAAQAAYALGLLEIRELRNYRAAVGWFDAYLEESPNGPLAREALGRAMDASERLGRRDAARRYATEYLARYPRGPQAEAARRIRDR